MYSTPSKGSKVSISENSLTINNKTFPKKEILTLEYEKPLNMAYAIFARFFSYIGLMIFIIGIPVYFYDVYLSSKNWTVKIVLKNEYDKKGKRKEVKFWMPEELVNEIRNNY